MIRTQPQNIWIADELHDGVEAEIDSLGGKFPEEYRPVMVRAAWLEILNEAWPAGNC